MRTFHFNSQYNMVGVALLLGSALLVFSITYLNNVEGSANITVPPLILGIFMLGYFTGRPCLVINDEYFEYRSFPFKRSTMVYLEDLGRIEIQGPKILVYSKGVKIPLTIKSHSFSKEQLTEVTDYFVSLKAI